MIDNFDDIYKQLASNFDDIYKQLASSLRKHIEIARRKGAFSWLSALPVWKNGYAIHKRALM